MSVAGKKSSECAERKVMISVQWNGNPVHNIPSPRLTQPLKNDLLERKVHNLPTIIFRGHWYDKLRGSIPCKQLGTLFAGKMFNMLNCRNKHISFSFKKDDGTDPFCIDLRTLPVPDFSLLVPPFFDNFADCLVIFFACPTLNRSKFHHPKILPRWPVGEQFVRRGYGMR